MDEWNMWVIVGGRSGGHFVQLMPLARDDG